jgi:hypothetical protein
VFPQSFDGLPLLGLIGLAAVVWLSERLVWVGYSVVLPGLSPHTPTGPPPIPQDVKPMVDVDAERSPLWDRELDG